MLAEPRGMGEHAKKEEAPDVFGHVKDGAEMVGGTGELGSHAFHAGTRPTINAPQLAQFNQMFQGAGVISGMADMGGGVNDIVNGNYVDGAIKLGSGGAGAMKSGAELMGYGHGAIQTLNKVGGAFDVMSGINNFAKGDYANGIKDTTSGALGFVAPQLVAPWKLGWGVGTGLNEQGAKDNLYGGHRTASKHAGDTGAQARDDLEALGYSRPGAVIGGGVVTLGQSVTNTIDSAINTMAMPQVVREMGADSGESRNPFSVSIMDVVGLGGLNDAVHETVQPKGPNIYDIVGQSVAYVNALKAQIEAQQAGQAQPAQPAQPQEQSQPFQGMY